ncbi:hypothetical protein AZE42_12908 [Rhizopogon vesiculosus]|uniref:Uncharacterized protein n=1 Tax=Rhizopogon vesiculosus TaxID=180088 RepID=A0A1J8QCM2_9AGAM|nr:hypothetical protein AZE42_12908 [Rhizopogon vesiculosus]
MPQSVPDMPEFTGLTGFHSFDPSHPRYPLQLDACVEWNADTGATSHMTPHRHWLEALQCPDADQWKQAAMEELNAHSTNGTW